MSKEQCVSRRASLKSLGAVGAAFVLDGVGAAASHGDPKPAAGNQDKPTVNVVDLAASRFTKGHS